MKPRPPFVRREPAPDDFDLGGVQRAVVLGPERDRVHLGRIGAGEAGGEELIEEPAGGDGAGAIVRRGAARDDPPADFQRPYPIRAVDLLGRNLILER